MCPLTTSRHRRLRVSQVPAGDPTLLADLPEHGPRFAGSTTVTTVLVRLAELTALVLPMR
jgi:hypothetical protein